MYLYKPDYEIVKKRYDAFWAGEILDRPLVTMPYMKDGYEPLKEKKYQTEKERWMDFDYMVEKAIHQFEHTVFAADTLPIAWPNLGPEIFSAACGCEYNFGETTTWSEPCIADWDKDFDKGKLDFNNEYFMALEKFTKVLLEAGKGKFIVGLTDFHVGGDHIAALRDPQTLCMDMIDDIDFVKEKLAQSYPEYFAMYDHFYDMIKEYDMPATTWIPVAGKGKFNVPSNDFSCMISNAMFEDVFLQGIIDECKFLDSSIYHLDGPGALIHLESILDIKELNGLQWVCGASNEGFHKWVHIYKRAQEKKKSILLYPKINELDLIFETLKPEGVWLQMYGIENKEQADYAMKRIKEWK